MTPLQCTADAERGVPQQARPSGARTFVVAGCLVASCALLALPFGSAAATLPSAEEAGARGVGTVAGRDTSSAAAIPVRPGLTIVSAVIGDAVNGDYESVVTVAAVSEQDIVLSASAEVKDDAGVKRRLDVRRRIRREDLAGAGLQILGFSTYDPETLPGTSALGPSLAVMRALRSNGRATYAVKNYARREASSGVVEGVVSEPVPFPVLLNGRRVVLPAIHVSGRLRHETGERPWELHLLDHPIQPLLLKVAYGAPGSSLPVTPEWTRQIVRIDLPEEAPRAGTGSGGKPSPGQGGEGGGGPGGGSVGDVLERALLEDCRVEVPGVYFEFDSASLNPQSKASLRSLSGLLGRRPEWHVRIEGHTDAIGGERHNQDLSARRAKAVREALVREFGVAAGRLTTAGFGESRPREPNETPEGRARNRRVEVVRPCSGDESRASEAERRGTK